MNDGRELTAKAVTEGWLSDYLKAILIFYKTQGASNQMKDRKIRIVKRRDNAVSKAAEQIRAVGAALHLSEKIATRNLTSSVHDWVLERNENRNREGAASRKRILTWKAE